MVRTRNASGKVNLGLHVLRRRTDGYHDLETVFYRIRWSDTVHARPATEYVLTCTDVTLPTDEANLVTKAAQALAARYGVPCRASLRLEKRLPVGSGLGGGSSDAAATLRLLAEFWQLDVSERTLRELALEIGSDVPFFLGAPLAYATGRGEVLRPLEGYRFPFALVVAVPPVQVSTAWAYGRISPNNDDRPNLRAVVESNDLSRWRGELANDFEAVVLEAHPILRQARHLMLDQGAGYASLSGTGAAVYGVFEDPGLAWRAREAAVRRGWRVWCELPESESSSSGPVLPG